MKKIIFLLIILFSTPVFASDGSVIYSVYSTIFGLIKNFSLNMHEGIILIYSRSYFLICAIASPIVLYAYARNKIDFDALIAYFIFLMISVALVVNKVYFVDIIYKPYFAILKKSIAFVMGYSGDITFSQINSLSDLFANIYNSTNNYTARLDKIAEFDWSSFTQGIFNIGKFIIFFINILILKALFFITSVIFVGKFIMIIFYIHIILVFLPVSISLFPFKSLRPYTFHNFKLLLQFLLNVMIMAMGISITLYTLFELNNLPLESIGSYEDGIGGTFFWASVISAFVGGSTIWRSGYLSSLILSAMGLPPSISSRVVSTSAKSKDILSRTGGMMHRGFNSGRSLTTKGVGLVNQAVKNKYHPKIWNGYNFKRKK